MAIKQIVSEHYSGTGVIDIYAEAGMEQPDLSLIDENFVDKFRKSDRPNFQIEMLKRLLSQEIKLVGKAEPRRKSHVLGDAGKLGAALPEPCPGRCGRGRRAG